MLTSSIPRAWLQLARQNAQLDLTRRQLEGLRAEMVQWQEGMALTRNQIAALPGKGPDRGLSIMPTPLPTDAPIA